MKDKILDAFQVFCGLLACIMCIFILGPIAFIICLGRVVINGARGLPSDYTDLRGSTPMFVTFMLLIGAVYGLSLI